DLELLERIAATVSAPLVLHGASGLADDEVLAAIDLGVAKLNVNSELRRAFLDALSEATETAGTSDGISVVMEPTIRTAQRLAQHKLRMFSTPRVRGATTGCQG